MIWYDIGGRDERDDVHRRPRRRLCTYESITTGVSHSQANARRLHSGAKDNPDAREEGPLGVKDVCHLSSLWPRVALRW